MGTFSMPPESPLQVILNTWFVLYAHDQPPGSPTFGGLPNDFLSRGAASLLVLDSALCDEDALSTEKAMPWVSSHLFKQLEKKKLLQPIVLRKAYSPRVMANLESHGILEDARRVMHHELKELMAGSTATASLRLPSSLRWINSVMATGVDLPGCLHYDWQESHFQALTAEAAAVTRRVAAPADAAAKAEREATRTDRFLQALAIVLPRFSLLPPIEDVAARAALRENIECEKRMMYRYIYGGMKHAEFEAFRSSRAFRERDRLIDSPDRFRQADQNLKKLIETRERTKDVRPHAQRVIREVIDGRRSIEDVRQELKHVRQIIEAALEAMPTKTALYVTSGVQTALGVVEGAETLFGHGGPVTLLQSVKAFLEAINGVHQAHKTQEFYRLLGREYPLSWIAAVHAHGSKP